ncbi:MAG: O-antigen polymerase [Pseudomonadota bacterium]
MMQARPTSRWLQPLVLIFLCWSLTGLAAIWILGRLHDLELVQTFMRREGISTSVFSLAGLGWVLFGLLAYAVGDLAARYSRSKPMGARSTLNHDRAAVVTLLANCVLLGVTLLWIVSAAAKAGGLVNLAAAAYADSLTTRDLLLENKLFTGMRLFYAALPATACMAAALLTAGQLCRSNKRWMWAVLAVNTLALLILPLVMSQRLLLLQLLLSAYFVACLIRGRIFGIGWGLAAIGLFALLWVGREAITNPSLHHSALNIATQKMAFYVINDSFNAVAPIAVPIHNTNGGLLLEGVMFFTFTDSYFLTLLEPRINALDPVIGGGEFPFFTAAYVDFGAKGGAAFICLAGFVLRRIYVRSIRSFGWTVVYAQIAAALMFSSHSVYILHQNFFFSAGLIAALVLLASVKSVAVPTVAKVAAPLPSERQFWDRRTPAPTVRGAVRRNLQVFRSYRSNSAGPASSEAET